MTPTGGGALRSIGGLDGVPRAALYARRSRSSPLFSTKTIWDGWRGQASQRARASTYCRRRTLSSATVTFTPAWGRTVLVRRNQSNYLFASLGCVGTSTRGEREDRDR